jgi:hypothetical protein
MEVPLSLFGPIDAILHGRVEYVLLVFAVANVAARAVAHRSTVRQAEQGGAEAISRHPALVATNVLLVLSAFYYTTTHYHGGIVVSTLVLGMVLTDFFEFEARKVEARNEMPIERPKSAMVAGLFVLSYAAYISIFFIIKPYWTQVV